jgi:hypothetical protein
LDRLVSPSPLLWVTTRKKSGLLVKIAVDITAGLPHHHCCDRDRPLYCRSCLLSTVLKGNDQATAAFDQTLSPKVSESFLTEFSIAAVLDGPMAEPVLNCASESSSTRAFRANRCVRKGEKGDKGERGPSGAGLHVVRQDTCEGSCNLAWVYPGRLCQFPKGAQAENCFCCRRRARRP